MALPMEPFNEQKTGMPKIGDRAPEFKAKTTFGDRSLSDYRDKWVVLFSHPADFTPVCTTEFLAFAENYSSFADRNVELIGLSVDSLSAHLAWVNNIREKTGTEIPFPVIADLTTEVARKFGMIHDHASETATVRCVFVIDPQQIIRAIIYYPMNVGRNIKEILRLVDALQMADKHSVAAPANWERDEPVVVPPPQNVNDLKKRLDSPQGCEVTDWYLVKKKI
ncbi:peroxiredoxin [Desmospora profundinema]|uniref:Peroxiredoxin n=1 Tax=Desmospora profundinema TaxID=1571184 RepID=A0ABU1IPX1_9BACL|nr:peroxiredoxin [Desmospora profundinema]MDR6225989.1 peroxiredoxin (alkyl hydroperoxide reductase subunit C) [Desmospora profundinema]